MSRRSQLANRLAGVPLFSRCDPRDLRIVARHTVVTDPGPGVELVVQGEEGDALYILLDGAATVRRNDAAVAHLGPGDYFGELALLDPSPRSATVVTTTDSSVAVLSARMFRVLLRDIPQLSAELLAQLAHRVRRAGAVPPTNDKADHETSRKDARHDAQVT